MIDDLKEFISRVTDFNSLKPSEQIDFFAYFTTTFHKVDSFNIIDIDQCFKILKIVPFATTARYVKNNSNEQRPKPKKIKFIKVLGGYHIEANYELELKNLISDIEPTFIEFKPEISQSLKPSDIPFLNAGQRKNAQFFTTLYYLLYHLENSLRKFLKERLSSILNNEWEATVISKVDLAKASAIRIEINLSEILPERGENILYYCMWDDYGKIISAYPQVFSKPKEAHEVVAHLNSLAKIRNAIAHNAVTIPKEYQDELTLFLQKYIKIMKHN